MKKLKKISLSLVSCGGFLVILAVMLQFFTSVGRLHPNFSEGRESYANVREIVAVSGALPITLVPTSSDECVVEWKSGLPLIVSCDEYGTLRITEDDSFTATLFSKNAASSMIKIEVPEKSYERIKLSSSAGDIICHEINCESLDIYTRNGDITAYGVNERSKIKSDSGNIYLSVNRFDGEMAVNGGEGDITIEISGDFGFFAEFMTESGGSMSEGFEKATSNRKGDAAFLNKNGGNSLKIYTTSGNLKISIKEE